MNILMPQQRPGERFADWLYGRVTRMRSYDTRYWRTSSVGVGLMCSLVLACTALGIPTGFGAGADIAVLVLLGLLGMVLAGYAGAFVFAVMYLPVPRFHTAYALYTGGVAYTAFAYADVGELEALAIALAVTAAAELLGIGLAVLRSRRLPAPAKAAAAVLAAASLWTAVYQPSIGVPAALKFGAADRDAVAADAGSAADQADGAGVPAGAVDRAGGPAQLAAADPAAPGAYRYRSFTYGSGTDRRRAEFAGGAEVRTQPVDASAYITKWKPLRTWFWGFDQHALPVNGRVWMPKGDGKFPLVLIVHGNHLMEQYSDAGYAYLGELFASRGFIAVSVDENFLNYSVWSGIPNQDMKVRAWMLLKHLQQLQELSSKEGSPFFGKIDWYQIGLIGHSRGGQAAAMAADRDRWFADDKGLDSLNGLNIKAVAAVAPTDTTVDHTAAKLKDTYYFTMQGAQDGDVNNFNGEEQYIRSSFSEGTERFKSSLYIGEANHSQFNSDWGRMDNSMPDGILLSRKGMLKAAEQRKIAKVYLSAFLETALHGASEYRGLFKDYRTGLDWLPEAHYINRFEDGTFLSIDRFDEDRNKMELSGGTANAEGNGLSWTEQDALNRDRKEKGTRGVVLEWKDEGAYTIELSPDYRQKMKGRNLSELVLNLADMGRDVSSAGNTVPEDWSDPDITMELRTADGQTSRLPLSDFGTYSGMQPTRFLAVPWLEHRLRDGKYKESVEPVFQTLTVPLSAFARTSPGFQPEQLTSITIRFSGGPGKIMLDDIGMK
ncbi:poly(ethylene terephthalate) hydrolase family protein [Paenibacillus gansuensis]|uniref:Alpha/beta hydrolase n=1 Tax=Paenibacillus gansuensis TaxID=306542 RepID=A0ABW5P9K7_9BACL